METTGDIVCPHCGSGERQIKAGWSRGKQRFTCQLCHVRYSVAVAVSGETKNEPITDRSVAGRQSASASPEKSPESKDTVTPPKRRPTIADVARQAGTSIATVSNYLNNRGRMGDETRVQIEAAMQSLFYSPSALTQALRRGRTDILGLLTSGITGGLEFVTWMYDPHVMVGINSAADSADVEVLLYTSWPHRRSRYTERNFLNGQIDGLLWMGPALEEPLLERVAASGLPVVALLTSDVPDGVGYVCCDNAGGIRALMQHLLALGHRSIAFAAGENNSDYEKRRTSYHDALRDAGIAAEPSLNRASSVFLSDDLSYFAGVLDEWQTLPSPPTAIVAGDDGIAARWIDCLQRRGLRVPEDMSVSGFNDIPEATRAGGGLTTVHQPFTDMGRIAVESLLALVNGADADDCRRVLPADLVVRKTTGPPRLR